MRSLFFINITIICLFLFSTCGSEPQKNEENIPKDTKAKIKYYETKLKKEPNNQKFKEQLEISKEEMAKKLTDEGFKALEKDAVMIAKKNFEKALEYKPDYQPAKDGLDKLKEYDMIAKFKEIDEDFESENEEEIKSAIEKYNNLKNKYPNIKHQSKIEKAKEKLAEICYVDGNEKLKTAQNEIEAVKAIERLEEALQYKNPYKDINEIIKGTKKRIGRNLF